MALKYLLEELSMKVDENDHMLALMPDTTLEQIRDNLAAINTNLKNAAGNARVAREAAGYEDARLWALAKEVDEMLRPKPLG